MLTGHTGFKGSWLSLWLQDLGAKVSGYSIDVPTKPSLYDTAAVGEGMNSETGDVRDLARLKSFTVKTDPEIVIHMAAQSLVRRSYSHPVYTYSTNVMGTVNLLESVRSVGDVRVVIIVTSDKCYDNEERAAGYRERDERQVLREPRLGLGIPGELAARGTRSLLEQQGLRRACDRGVQEFVL